MIINRNFMNKKFFMDFSKTNFYRNASSAIVNETDKCIKINWSILTNAIPNAYANTVSLYKVNDNMYANNATAYNYFKLNREYLPRYKSAWVYFKNTDTLVHFNVFNFDNVIEYQPPVYYKPNTESKEIDENTNVDPDEESLF